MGQSTTTEHGSAQQIVIKGGRPIQGVAFLAQGAYLVGGDDGTVRLWRSADGQLVEAMVTGDVHSLAVSSDSKWIGSGTMWGEVTVWDAHTYERVLSHKDDAHTITAVDFSPDSTRLIIASVIGTASIIQVPTGKRIVGPLCHQSSLTTAKFSPQGDRIAISTLESIRVYDSHDGSLLFDIQVRVRSHCNTGLVWSDDGQCLFVSSDSKIKQVQVSTASPLLEWPVPDSDAFPCVTLAKHGKFIAYSANHTVTLWDTSTRTQLGQVIQHVQDVSSIAFSPDDRFLATVMTNGEIAVKSVRDFLPPILFTGPFIHVGDTTLDFWDQDQFAHTEMLLTEEVVSSENLRHHSLANRALVRARQQLWDAALADADQSIQIQPSVLGFIARGVALVGGGKKHDGYQACDLAFKHCHSDYVDHLLLIKAVIVCMAGEHDDAISRIAGLIPSVENKSIYYVVQAYMYLLLGNLHMENKKYENAIQSFEHARGRIQGPASPYLTPISLISGWKFDDLRITIQRNVCEALFAAGRAQQAAESFMRMVNHFSNNIYMSNTFTEWVSHFTQRLLATRNGNADSALEECQHVEAITRHASISSSNLPTCSWLLTEWVKAKLIDGPWEDVLSDACSIPRSMIYLSICERLENDDRLVEATDCFQRVVSDFSGETDMHDEQVEWVNAFKGRCSRKLERLGDAAMRNQQYNQAIARYSAILSLSPSSPQDVFIKRSKAFLATGLWEEALDDANQAIIFDPSSPWGYETKHAALHYGGRYDDAVDALKIMHSKIHAPPRQYVNPQETTTVIREAVRAAIRDSPRVLINTISGRLLDKSQQELAFESLPVFKELVSSMTIRIDRSRIDHEVIQYYQYAMLSHTWEENEPLFQEVIHAVVYDLEQSPTHVKLQMFCKIVRDAGLYWAWGDTCCINKQDHVVLQEALVAMFKWYHNSAVTIVHLRGVRNPRGLVRSLWNSRAWTLQEYLAAKVIRFYTEDWVPYMNLDILNHKASFDIMAEMAEAARISARELMALRPGLDDIRLKLCLASRRKATRVEDTAYSMLGMFSLSMPVIYGEGDKALGGLLGQLLAGSGDTSILAWSGKSGSFNSCFPTDISVFSRSPLLHIPHNQPATEEVSEAATPKFCMFSSRFASAMKLYNRLNELPAPSLSGIRIILPCITFPLGRPQRTPQHRYRAKSVALGTVEINSTEDISALHPLYLVHPWIDFLLDRHPVGDIADATPESPSSSTSGTPTRGPDDVTPSGAKKTRLARLVTPLMKPWFGGRAGTPPRDGVSLQSPLRISQRDRRRQALRLITRLRQPFGALLFTHIRQNVPVYRRVAADSIITVQVQDNTPLQDLLDNVRLLDVL